MRAPCSIDGCDRPSHGRGWCKLHYGRWLYRKGDPSQLLPTPNGRRRPDNGDNWRWITDAVATRDRTDGCWLDWPFGRSSGYPCIKGIRVGHLVLRYDGRPRPDESYEVLHSCDVKLCVNPAHIRWGTRKENTREAIERGLFILTEPVTAALQRALTHCPYGHPYSGDNLYVRGNHRRCRECARERDRRRRPSKARAGAA